MRSVRQLVRRGSGAASPTPPDPAAATRRLHERDPAEPLRVAVVTYARDEGAMLPRWVSYYGGQLGVEHLYVVDDSSSDGSTDDLPCTVLRVPPVRGGRFESTRMGFLGGLSRGLLELYDAVLFCDADEFHVPDPQRYAGLRDFVERQPADRTAVAALGLNLVHLPGSEPALDPARPVLGQRSVAKFLPVMCKPALKFVPAPWCAASHGLRAPYVVDPDLWMFHLKFADRDLLQAAADRRRALVEADGRSGDTQWRHGGDVLVELLDRIGAGVDAAAVPDFVPPAGTALAELVVGDRPGVWRAPKGGQLQGMERRALVRVPDRFHGLV